MKNSICNNANTLLKNWIFLGKPGVPHKATKILWHNEIFVLRYS